MSSFMAITTHHVESFYFQALNHEPGPTLDPCVLLGERTLTSRGTKTKRVKNVAGRAV